MTTVECRERGASSRWGRLRRVATVAAVLIAATVATSTIGAGQANALTGWTPYTVIAQSSATVGSVTTTAQIRRGTELNRYYTKVTCTNTNPAQTLVRVDSGYSRSENAKRLLGIVYTGEWNDTIDVGYSDPYIAYNDRLDTYGICQYLYNGHTGWVMTPWSAKVWVGYWTG
jgi:hypothetical protein